MTRFPARITDMTHMDAEPASMSSEAARIADFLGRIVAAASRHPTPETLVSVIRCRRRPNRRPCPGHISFTREDAENRVAWRCQECGDCGIITHWTGTRWDLSWPLGLYGSLPALAWFLVSPDEFQLLQKLDWEDEHLTSVLAGAVWADEHPRDIGMPASRDELQSLQAIFGAEMDSSYDRHRGDRINELWERIDFVLDTV